MSDLAFDCNEHEWAIGIDGKSMGVMSCMTTLVVWWAWFTETQEVQVLFLQWDNSFWVWLLWCHGTYSS